VSADAADAAARDHVPRPDAVRDELERILASEEFVASDRLKSFLRFVVEESLAGRADRLKAYTIALEVFGRDESFDPASDPVVRMEAGKLRRRLEHYYLGAGQRDAIRIEIPKGGYAPTFSHHPDEERADASPATPAPWRPLQRGWPGPRWLGLGALALAALILLAAIALRLESPTVEAEAGHPALQQRGPAIIVLPFEDLSKGGADDVFASGLTEELISNLMRIGELRLYSAYGSFLEQPTADAVALSKRLHVGYVVKGSVRREPDRVRLIVHLIEARSGQHLWSETYDRELTPENVFEIQEQLATDLAGQLAQPYGIVNEVTAASFRRQRSDSLVAYECVLRAFAYRRTWDPKLYAPARECLEDAARQDPEYADAWALLAFAQLDEYRFGYGARSGDPAALDVALDTAQQATDLDRDNVLGLLALSSIRFYRREFAQADEAHRRVLSLNPANPEVLAQVGWRTAFARDWDEGIALVQLAIDRSIKAPEWYHLIRAFHRYRHGDYKSALADVNVIAGSNWVWGPLLLAAIQGQLGNPDEAQQALDRTRALNPRALQDPGAAMRLHNLPEDLIDRVIDGLRKAGLDVPVAAN
jgi:TolB-like protein/Tfp pilus assembly protein PilF